MIRILTAVFSSVLLAGCFSQQPAPAVDRNNGVQSRATPPTMPSGPGYYTVKRGDTLNRIARENGQDYRDVALWNNIADPSVIKEGQVLRVAPPGPAVDSNAPVLAKPVAVEPVVESRSLDQPATTVEPSVAATQGGNLKREPKAGKEPYSDEAYARLNNLSAEQVSKPLLALPPVESKPEAKVDPASVVVTGPDGVQWIWPVPSKVTEPYSKSGNKGLNFEGNTGDPILAAADGKVIYAGASIKGYGNFLVISHRSGLNSVYAHNRKILVKEGQQVVRGQKIAEMGNTDADSVKLHFEIRKEGKPVDPAQYLPKR